MWEPKRRFIAILRRLASQGTQHPLHFFGNRRNPHAGRSRPRSLPGTHLRRFLARCNHRRGALCCREPRGSVPSQLRFPELDSHDMLPAPPNLAPTGSPGPPCARCFLSFALARFLCLLALLVLFSVLAPSFLTSQQSRHSFQARRHLRDPRHRHDVCRSSPAASISLSARSPDSAAWLPGTC